jgi:DNA-binding transcriptional LysR family regulator
MQTHYPDITLQLVPSVSGKILAALRDKTLDVGYVFGPVSEAGLIGRRVGTANLVVAMPKGWESCAQFASWEDLASLPWLFGDVYCPFQDLVEELFTRCQLAYRRAVQASDEVTKLELVSAGVGVALLEESEACTAATAGKLAIWKGDPLRCELALVYARARQHDRLIQAVVSTVLSAWGLDI